VVKLLKLQDSDAFQHDMLIIAIILVCNLQNLFHAYLKANEVLFWELYYNLKSLANSGYCCEKENFMLNRHNRSVLR
jgi:hypothetical protein